jgi:lipid-binding SYLF domain-containing protein
MKKIIFSALIMISLVLLSQADSFARWKPGQDKSKGVKQSAVDSSLSQFRSNDPGFKAFFNAAYGYAIFPRVAKGGIGVGGAYGKGKVYEKGKFIGRTTLTQITIGFQLGGQEYSEIIFFKDKRALDDFTDGNFEFGAQASAVALTTGASATAAYDNGVAIFTVVRGGLMYEASVGGQKFKFMPK